MTCLTCKSRMYVVETRGKENITYRRYKCKACGSYLYTTEQQSGQAKRNLTIVVREKEKEDGRKEELL